MKNINNKIIVILGPTASGKSQLAIKIAKKFNGEIISADSRQIYKGLNIGTEKITKKEMKGVKHHMIDIVKPQKTYTVVQYQKAAKKILNGIFKKNKFPIIVGGSGFYIDALIYDYKLPAVAPQKGLRKRLEKKSLEELFRMLQKFDPKRAANIDPCNRRRLVRALEIVITTGSPVPPLERNAISVNQRNQRKSATAFAVLKIGIKKTPNELRQLINQRLEKTLKKGLIEEIEKLHKKGLNWKRFGELGLEYRLAADYLRGLISYEEMTEQMKKEIYRYAKRQITWFKRDKSIIWIKTENQARSMANKFLLL
ncbi:MAG: tRNA (adenosine(37)-N6)-dimethylallyltransferase MiaA [bacterium]|nr:tRNA (adenosine(37)-N6)-dimethylallyltransferase MiaA [bacterium]